MIHEGSIHFYCHKPLSPTRQSATATLIMPSMRNSFERQLQMHQVKNDNNQRSQVEGCKGWIAISRSQWIPNSQVFTRERIGIAHRQRQDPSAGAKEAWRMTSRGGQKNTRRLPSEQWGKYVHYVLNHGCKVLNSASSEHCSKSLYHSIILVGL